MAYALLDDQFADHPKVVRAGEAAAWLFVAALCYCARHLTDGLIPASMLHKLTTNRNPKRLAEKLVEVRLWERAGEDFQIHDYLDWNPSGDAVRQKRAKTTKRVAEWRLNKVGNNVGNAVTNDVGTPEVRPPPSPSVEEEKNHAGARESTKQEPTALGGLARFSTVMARADRGGLMPDRVLLQTLEELATGTARAAGVDALVYAASWADAYETYRLSLEPGMRPDWSDGGLRKHWGRVTRIVAGTDPKPEPWQAVKKSTNDHNAEPARPTPPLFVPLQPPVTPDDPEDRRRGREQTQREAAAEQAGANGTA